MLLRRTHGWRKPDWSIPWVLSYDPTAIILLKGLHERVGEVVYQAGEWGYLAEGFCFDEDRPDLILAIIRNLLDRIRQLKPINDMLLQLLYN